MTCYNDWAARTYADKEGDAAEREEAVWVYEADIMSEGDTLSELLENEAAAQWVRSVHLTQVKLTTPDEQQAYAIAYQMVADYCELTFDAYSEKQRRLNHGY